MSRRPLPESERYSLTSLANAGILSSGLCQYLIRHPYQSTGRTSITSLEIMSREQRTLSESYERVSVNSRSGLATTNHTFQYIPQKPEPITSPLPTTTE